MGKFTLPSGNVELPHYIKMDIALDLLVSNYAYTKALAEALTETLPIGAAMIDELAKKHKFEILAYVASKYGK